MLQAERIQPHACLRTSQQWLHLANDKGWVLRCFHRGHGCGKLLQVLGSCFCFSSGLGIELIFSRTGLMTMNLSFFSVPATFTSSSRSFQSRLWRATPSCPSILALTGSLLVRSGSHNRWWDMPHR